MPGLSDIRPNEVAVAAPAPTDAGLVFIGRIRTPWATRAECPKRGDPEGPVCRIEIFEPWGAALEGVSELERIEVFYWLHEARRDLVIQSPGHGPTRGTFALRSPVRPNPIGVSGVAIAGVEGSALLVRGLDCLDGTPLIDLKPGRCPPRTDAAD
ncbi:MULTISPECIES: tRNA (N6-threonylcarbamoyladenosine(37)-N6)-methyltransferase TrmO [Rhodomicrobium]|uniref:tRNA (N6-threonylcarbamoyladenosine(37)-N6)-methyltransferase TrmO n=1 Tax=Rhodomicrobium TaxID=1068 RepID=UPI000B4AFE51|nr:MULTISPECIES: tRNA (N6-threonylcarbamoyladenosine(37)-N6)-methyltransferase TrmO [Rhodomicrobium]